MKTKFKLLWAFSTLLLLINTSCEKEFLHEETTSFISPEQLLLNEEGAEIYVIGAYDAIRVLASSFDGWFSMWGTLGADEIVVPNWGTDTKEIYPPICITFKCNHKNHLGKSLPICEQN